MWSSVAPGADHDSFDCREVVGSDAEEAPRSATIESIQQGNGKVLGADITKMGTVTAFAERAGILRQALYRLLGGETVGTDLLLRALRALERRADIEILLEPPHETPLEKVDKPLQRRATKRSASLSKLTTAKPETR